MPQQFIDQASGRASDHTRLATRLGGVSLILATVLFAAVFIALARSFGYPEVLDLPAEQVLPRLLALGPVGRAVWLVYGLIPLLLLPTALGVHAATRQATPLLARAAVLTAVLAAAAMVVGLMRWPSLHWQLAQAHATASPAAREAIAAVFAASNSYLGNVIGEFLGELFLNLFFLFAAIALSRAAGPARRWLLVAGVAASLLGGLAMLRNATGLVAPLADINNAMLPLWMLVLGVALWRRGAGQAAAPQALRDEHSKHRHGVLPHATGLDAQAVDAGVPGHGGQRGAEHRRHQQLNQRPRRRVQVGRTDQAAGACQGPEQQQPGQGPHGGEVGAAQLGGRGCKTALGQDGVRRPAEDARHHQQRTALRVEGRS